MNLQIKPMTEEDLKKMLETHKTLNPDLPIREDIKEAMDRYIQHGLPLGSFLTAVMENNLMLALGKADSYNRATIFQICQYVYNELPSDCHGSPEKVEAWFARFHDQSH